MMLHSTYTLSPALVKVFSPIKEEDNKSQVFFPKIDDLDLPTHFNLPSYVQVQRNNDER